MIGAIAGDMIGSVYEATPIKRKDFPLFSPRSTFTDDTVLSVAVAFSILTGSPYGQAMREIGGRYPHCGYGKSFKRWLRSDHPQPYNSYGNGSAMRASPVGYAYPTVEEVLEQAKRSAEVTHNHPEGIKGAQAAALAVFLARSGSSKEEIRSQISERFGYSLNRTVNGIRPTYSFDLSCQGTVPEAIIAFLDSDSWEDAVRNAVSLGGDSDTLACITGGIADAYYRSVPEDIRREVEKRLPTDLRTITDTFTRKFC